MIARTTLGIAGRDDLPMGIGPVARVAAGAAGPGAGRVAAVMGPEGYRLGIVPVGGRPGRGPVGWRPGIGPEGCRLGMAWPGIVGPGIARPGMVRPGTGATAFLPR